MPGLIAAFMVYGIFGLTEPVEKAWVADLAPAALRGSAFGCYHAVVGLGALPASLVFGLVWQLWGAPAAFGGAPPWPRRRPPCSCAWRAPIWAIAADGRTRHRNPRTNPPRVAV